MLKSIYTPLSGALSQERVLETISNNLANVNTVGFKGDRVAFTLLDAEPKKQYKNPLPPANYKVDMMEHFPLKGNELEYVGVAGIERDSAQGPALTTHNPLDLMIEGKGFFTVNTPKGQRYTRNGAFTLNQDGMLATKLGHPVMGEKGTIHLSSSKFEINLRGEVLQEGEIVDRLVMSDFKENASLERVGENYFHYRGAPEDMKVLDHPVVRQGYLEGSNVNAIKSLTSMILAHRSYEAYTKAVQNYDKMMEKSSNSIGEVRA